jgi:uncharacterized DUF497 family protein
MRFAHDPQKLAANVAGHKVWFHEAEGFEWETASVVVDSRQRYGESRLVATGLMGERLYVLVFTLRETTVRIISLRKANNREKLNYAKLFNAS